jgi:hypothetical protein
MTRSVRPTTAADLRPLCALFDAAGLHPNVEPQELEWKYWRPRGDWPGPRSFLLADENDALAHAAIVPGWCAQATRRGRIGHLIDWVARPGAAGAGVALLKRIGQQVEALLAVGGSAETRQILPHIGFRPAGVVTGFVRPLHPLRLLRDGTIPAGRRLLRAARNLTWAFAAPAARRLDLRPFAVTVEDLGRIEPVLPRPAPGRMVVERSAALFAYVLACPIVPVRLFGVERSGRVRGYFLLASAPGQVRIADCWMDSDEPADWRAMLLCAVAEAQHDPQFAEVAIWASDPLLAQALAGCGFQARFELPLLLRSTHAGPTSDEPLRVQMLDSDAAFLHEGRRGYWA